MGGYAVGPHGDNGLSDRGRSNYHKIDLYNQGIIVAYRYIYLWIFWPST
jgi:hypothetical protein